MQPSSQADLAADAVADFGYFVAVLDRSNVGVAALTMNHDLGLSMTAFGVAAGIFFVPYVVLELPSNLALAAFGARLWMARIMITWGLISAAHALVWNATSLYVARAALGAAEAGFVPGVIFYITLWFPAAYRGRIIAAFFIGIPIALVFGSPVSGLLLGLDGVMGLHGWQWIYLLEAVPAVALGVAIPFLLPQAIRRPPPSSPTTSALALVRRLALEQQERSAGPQQTLWRSIVSPRVLLLALAYYGLTNLNGAISTFLPQILRELGGVSNLQASALAAIPYAFGAVGMVVLGGLPPSRAAWPGQLLALVISAVGCSRRRHRRPGAEDGRPMLRRVRRVRGHAGVLGPAHGAAVRHRGGRRHRPGERARQSLQRGQPVGDRHDPRLDRQLQRRPALAGGHGGDIHRWRVAHPVAVGQQRQSRPRNPEGGALIAPSPPSVYAA